MKNDNTELWENRELGASEEHVRVSKKGKSLDDKLGLQAISIRLPKTLIANLKAIAAHHDIGYQPMVRDLLNRFADAEMKQILIQQIKDIEEEETQYKEDTAPVSDFIASIRKKA